LQGVQGGLVWEGEIRRGANIHNPRQLAAACRLILFYTINLTPPPTRRFTRGRIVKAVVCFREVGNVVCTLVDGLYLAAVVGGGGDDEVSVWEKVHSYVVNRRIPKIVEGFGAAGELLVLGLIAKDFLGKGAWGWGVVAINGAVERAERFARWKEGRGNGVEDEDEDEDEQ